MKTTFFHRTSAIVAAAVAILSLPARADEVLDWNAELRRVMAAVPGAPAFRLAAIVQVSVFEAVNGIERRYTPIRVKEHAPPGASVRAAAVQAAYTALLALFPAEKAALDLELSRSLAGIAADPAVQNSQSIARGRAWGERVANEIVAWRSRDGFDPSPSTYTGSLEPGKWRPTPPAFANGAVPSLAHTLPWVIPSPSSFRPPGPPSLMSARYAADFNEEKLIGEDTSAVRTSDQTTAVRFWAATGLTFFHRAAAAAALQRHNTLSENARLFALLSMAGADAVIACWEAKYTYSQWRPVSAIRLAGTDGNPATTEQAEWTPLLVTPPYPDYPSGHTITTRAMQSVLTAYFGHLPVEGWSEAFGESYTRSYPSFAVAADEANLSRIWAGIHWRHAVLDAQIAGNAIGAYVAANAARPAHGEQIGSPAR